MSDPSAAKIRTTLAWRRTSLALAVLATLAIKLAVINHQTTGIITSIFALVGAAILYLFGHIRFSNEKGPLLLLMLSATIITLLSIATLLQLI